MNTDLLNIAMGRGAYVLILAIVLAAVATAGVPWPIFLCLLTIVVVIGIITEMASRLLARKLSSLSPAADDELVQRIRRRRPVDERKRIRSGRRGRGELRSQRRGAGVRADRELVRERPGWQFRIGARFDDVAQNPVPRRDNLRAAFADDKAVLAPAGIYPRH